MTRPTSDAPPDVPRYEGADSPTKAAADAGRALKEEAAERTAEVRDAATAHVRDRAESARKDLAESVSSVSDALNRASEELRSGSPQERLFGRMAGSLAELADAVRGRDVPQLIDDLEAFGRRNPMAFLGGAALLGFAGVRMARAARQGEERNVATTPPRRSTRTVATPAAAPYAPPLDPGAPSGARNRGETP